MPLIASRMKRTRQVRAEKGRPVAQLQSLAPVAPPSTGLRAYGGGVVFDAAAAGSLIVKMHVTAWKLTRQVKAEAGSQQLASTEYVIE